MFPGLSLVNGSQYLHAIGCCWRMCPPLPGHSTDSWGTGWQWLVAMPRSRAYHWAYWHCTATALPHCTGLLLPWVTLQLLTLTTLVTRISYKHVMSHVCLMCPCQVCLYDDSCLLVYVGWVAVYSNMVVILGLAQVAFSWVEAVASVSQSQSLVWGCPSGSSLLGLPPANTIFTTKVKGDSNLYIHHETTFITHLIVCITTLTLGTEQY